MIKDKLANVTRIIVHPGRAHLDDFLSIALATQFVKVRRGDRIVLRIERKKPSLEELQDDSVLIFDVGEKHEPDLLNFDHHGIEVESTSSFQLFLEAIGMWEEFKMVHPWAERVSFMDHRGPSEWADKNEVKREVIPTLLSPLEDAILCHFSAFGELDAWTLLTLEMLGKYCISLIDEVEQCKKDIMKSHETFITPKGILGFIYTGETKPRVFPAATHALARAMGWEISVTPDDRTDGWSVYRFSRTSNLNLKLAEGHPDVLFAHRSGFLVKVKKDANIADIIDMSIE